MVFYVGLVRKMQPFREHWPQVAGFTGEVPDLVRFPWSPAYLEGKTHSGTQMFSFTFFWGDSFVAFIPFMKFMSR